MSDTVSYTLRNIPGELHRRLKDQARTNYRSLQAEMLQILQNSLSPRVERLEAPELPQYTKEELVAFMEERDPRHDLSSFLGELLAAISREDLQRMCEAVPCLLPPATDQQQQGDDMTDDKRSAHLLEDRSSKGEPLWWVDLADEDGVQDQASFLHDQREAALAYCAQWVINGMILEYARCDGEDIVTGHELLRTLKVRDSQVVDK